MILVDLVCRVFGIGKDRVKINPNSTTFKPKQIRSRADVRNAVESGNIVLLPKNGVSRHKPVVATVGPRQIRLSRVRTLRKILKTKKDTLESKSYRRIYKAIKQGILLNKYRLVKEIESKACK
jgi:ribosomal protein L19E